MRHTICHLYLSVCRDTKNILAIKTTVSQAKRFRPYLNQFFEIHRKCDKYRCFYLMKLQSVILTRNDLNLERIR